jgi:hypothetical protein
MNNLKVYEEFDFEEFKKEGNRYDVEFDEETQGSNHLVMKSGTEKKGTYGRSFDSNDKAAMDIIKFLREGYEIWYYGPDLDYAQEIVD